MRWLFVMNTTIPRLLVTLSALCLLVAAAPGPAGDKGAESPDCTSCHDQGQKLKVSAHGGIRCQDCHPKHEEYPHSAGIGKPACAGCHSSQARDYAQGVHGQAAKRGNAAAPDCGVCHGGVHEVAPTGADVFRKAVPDTCGMCHEQILSHFKASVHGKAIAQGFMGAPVCTDCHGEHSILSKSNVASSVNARQIPETCGHCHGNVRLTQKFGLPPDRLTSFEASFHGLASKTGSQTVANCASCHGVHDILPSSDPRSTISPKNLPTTCGKCHAGAGKRFALGTIHLGEGGREPEPLRWVRIFYLALIPGVIGFMLLHHGGDWVRKLVRLRLAPKSPGGSRVLLQAATREPEMRMYAFERVQHGLVVVSFAVLVWTGFALKYPTQWWALPLIWWESSWPVRGVIHRVAAGVLMGVSVVHVVALIFSRRLRDHWRTLWPRKNDLWEALAGFAYSVGLRKTKPAISPHSYVEKIEYWAVIWGVLIMAATGVVLWANNLALAWLPKTWLDVATSIHFYEAVLASLSIFIWHMYGVIFDPEVYPMDPAWLTGYSVRRREPHGLAPRVPGRETDLSARPE